MNETLVKLRILAQAEVMLAKSQGRRLGNRVAMGAIAIGMLLLAVVMLNVGAYQYLGDAFGDGAGALIVATANLLLMAVPISLGRAQKAGPEEAMVQEIREMALTEISADVQEVQETFAGINSDVKRIQTTFSSLGGGLGSLGSAAGLGGLAPLLTLLIKMLKGSGN